MDKVGTVLKVLVCDDDYHDRKLIRHHLDSIKDREIAVIEAERTNEIKEALTKGRIDLVFLDLQMPGKSGMEWLSDITEKQLAPVVILTGFGSEEIAVESLHIGAVGYLSKVNLSTNKVNNAISNALDKWEKYLLLRGDLEELDRVISHDQLTGLLNRRTLIKKMDDEINRTRRYGDEFAILMLDIDHFKKVNDTYGHLIGDEVLEKIGTLLRKKIRETDVAGRYGGEEFIIILSRTDLNRGLTVASRIRKAITNLKIKNSEGQKFKVTASLGLTVYTAGDNKRLIIERADNALFLAKSAGRNRIRTSEAIASEVIR